MTNQTGSDEPEDLHLDAGRVSILIHSDKLESVQVAAELMGLHVHESEANTEHVRDFGVEKFVEPKAGEVWITVCSGMTA